MTRTLEVCCYSIEDARVAEAAGADRIELCAGRPEGGTTASIGLLELAREVINIPVFPMVRPRGGDFIYGPDEFSAMCRDVAAVVQLDFPGVVFGVLKADRTVDVERVCELVDIADSLQVTFHRAFDEVADPISAYSELAGIPGITRLLTSGQQPTAIAGAALIEQLVKQPGPLVKQPGPLVMPGGGVRPGNVTALLLLGATEVHSSATASQTTSIDPQLVAQLAAAIDQF